MCGILFCAGDDLPPRERLATALSRMSSRGPDAQQLHVEPDYAIGHTRLSIIAPGPDGDQPFWDASRRYVLSYNGEIYNYRELRQELVRRGRPLRTRSDTEVLLEHLLSAGVEQTLERVRGMFAFVLYDTVTRQIVAARDHFGQKPLYYRPHAAGIAIASDVQSLLDLGEHRSPDLHAYSVYLCPAGEQGTRGVFHPERTFFDGIRMLPAGHLLRGVPESWQIEEYFNVWSLFDVDEAQRQSRRSSEDCLAELRQHLGRAVERHLVSDVQTGVLLSGGVDSSLVYARAYAVDPGVKAFTKLSPGIEQIPLTVIPQLLQRWPATIHFSVQRPSEYLQGLERFIAATRAPSRWGSGPPMHALCTDARREGVCVLLGGDGADEYFSGYRHCEDMRAEQPDPWKLSELVSLNRASAFYSAELAADYETREREVRRRIVERLSAVDGAYETALQATLLHDTSSFLQTCTLPHSDAYAMMTSVELRNPMLDMDLVRYGINLPEHYKTTRHRSGHFGKWMMRELASRDIGAFINEKKEGTRNYAMAIADPSYWDLSAFALAELFPLPAQLTRREVIRLINLEIFHRQFFLGQTDVVDTLLTAHGRASARSPQPATEGVQP